MGLSSAVQWWDEWQLRVLVLSSLGVQYLLAIFAGGRRFPVPRWYRFLCWLCYLGSDALAIYALATLFNRQRKQQYKFAQGSRDLEVLWAPILLMHLGGQVFITAYNIEDNELWSRHIVTAISQITVALYVFCKSWSSSADRRLLASSIFLFILGIAKCIEKSLSLKGASFNSLASDSHPAKRTPTKNREKELEKYIRKARAFILNNNIDPPPKLNCSTEEHNMEQLSLPDKLFVDSAYPYSVRIANLESFFVLDNQKVYDTLNNGLGNIFNLLYTKYDTDRVDSVYKCSASCYAYTGVATVVLSIMAIFLFHSSHKKSYSSRDVKVSLVLLYGTFLLDILSIFAFLMFSCAESCLHGVAQHSLIGFFSRNKRHNWFMDNQFMNNRFMEPCYSSRKITNIIRGYVLDGWKNYIADAKSYQEFSDLRGQWKLEREGCGEHLGWSLEKPFDESILLWHMATDFRFHRSNTSSDDECANRCREISNYMMHLLFANPEMLMPGSRRNLVRTAYEELEDILEGVDSSLDEQKLTKEIIKKVRSGKKKLRSGKGSEESFIHDAWMLAKGLKKLGDNRKMWRVIQGVWVEMLCFSASRCRGYLHAQSLGTGVEYLSYVWLLLAHAGMETLPERFQRTHKLRLSNVREHAAAPSASQGEATVPVLDEILVTE